jgi:ABC-type tungstate transport system permease subunit
MPVRFLSRYDKSAANIKESNLWSAIGQTPWSYAYSNWYHRYVDFPFQALKVAAQLGEYTFVDRGTWFSVEPWIRAKMDVFVRSSSGFFFLLLPVCQENAANVASRRLGGVQRTILC